MADEGKEFPDEFSPVPTPLTGSERVLVEKGTATVDDIKAFSRTNLPAPSAASDAATKGYVDARPGAEEWSKHAATQDVDLDGHKLTGLGEPTDASDAATKAYVDGAAPAKIERTFSWGRSVAEVTDDGNIELAVYLTGETSPLRRVRVPRGNSGLAISLMNRNASGFVSMLSVGTVSPSLTYAVTDGPAGSTARGGFTFNGGRWWFNEQNNNIPLGSNNYYALPAGVSSIKHGIHLAKEAYDTLASMPAPTELEWWDPVWTPVENVDSVSNVECSYTRTYRAAGGSLVTLEGTIEVEIDNDNTFTLLSAPLPVPATITGALLAPAICTAAGRADRSMVRTVVTDTGSGPFLSISAPPLLNATGVPATLTIGFRVSYRAA